MAKKLKRDEIVTTDAHAGPIRLLVHGESGSGRTTFLTWASSPIFISLDRGAEFHRNLPRIRTPREGRWTADSVRYAIRWLSTEEHDFKTVVIESLEVLERLLIDEIEARLVQKAEREGDGPRTFNELNDEERGGGFDLLADAWREILLLLEELQRKKGMDVALSATTSFEAFMTLSSELVMKATIGLSKKVSRLTKSWADYVFFIEAEEVRNVQEETPPPGRRRYCQRFLCCTLQPDVDAKARGELPWPQRIACEVAQYKWFLSNASLVNAYGRDLPAWLNARLSEVLGDTKGELVDYINESFQRELDDCNYDGALTVIGVARSSLGGQKPEQTP